MIFLCFCEMSFVDQWTLLLFVSSFFFVARPSLHFFACIIQQSHQRSMQERSRTNSSVRDCQSCFQDPRTSWKCYGLLLWNPNDVPICSWRNSFDMEGLVGLSPPSPCRKIPRGAMWWQCDLGKETFRHSLHDPFTKGRLINIPKTHCQQGCRLKKTMSVCVEDIYRKRTRRLRLERLEWW